MNDFASSVIDSLQKSKFIFVDWKTLEIDNAVIIWKNFSGKANRFGDTTKHFNIVVNKEVADELAKKGVRIYSSNDTDSETGEPSFRFFDVKINMDNAYPPLVTVFTDYNGVRTHNALNKETIGALDQISIESSDCAVHFYMADKSNGKATAYLHKLNVINHKVDEFGGKYANWDNVAVDSSSSQEPKPDGANIVLPKEGLKVADHDITMDAVDGDDAPKKEGKKK